MASAGLDACSLKLELSILHSVDDDHDDDHDGDYDDDHGDIYIMMSVCLSEKSSLLGFSWFLVGFHGF